jgi:ankyrin repeat protein
MVTFLYQKGARLDVVDSQGYNILHLAAHAGHSMLIAYLLALGIDVDAPDAMGRTALMWVAYQGNSVESMDILLKEQPSLNKTDQTGFTALHWAVSH